MVFKIKQRGVDRVRVKSLCSIIAAACLCLTATTAFAERNECIFFAPQSMNEENEIIVPIYAKNLPQNNDGLCGTEFSFVYDKEQFALKADENGSPVLDTSSAMLVQNTDNIDISVNEDIVSVSYVDFSGEKNVVLRDGPLFYFTLIPKNPDALWNSDDYYPLRFIPNSVNLVTLDRQNFSLSGMPAEGIDTYIGGYNAFPDFELPKIGNVIEFKVGSTTVYVNGEEKEIDAPTYMTEEIMIPIRFLAEVIGMELYWDENSRTVSLYQPYISVYLNMSDGDVFINAKKRTDLSKAEITKDRTFVPVSTVQEIFGSMLSIENNGDSISLNFK